MPPKISHVQIRPSLINPQSGKWYAKEITSADKSEKTLVFFQRPGQRSLKDFISDKLNGVRSGCKIASKRLTELGVTASCEVRTDSPRGRVPQVSENTLHAFLSDKIKTPATPGGQPVPPGGRAGFSVRGTLSEKSSAKYTQFSNRLWRQYTGDMNKADFMRLAKTAQLLGGGKLSFSDEALVKKVDNFLGETSVEPPVGSFLADEFAELKKAFNERRDSSSRAAKPDSEVAADKSGRAAATNPDDPDGAAIIADAFAPIAAGAPSLENRLLAALNSGQKEDFCREVTQEFIRLRAGKPGWQPATEIPVFHAKIAKAFDIAKDEERVQKRIDAIGSEIQQAKQLLYLSADREVTPATAKASLDALDMLFQQGIDPDAASILKDMRNLIEQARDQSSYDD